MKHDWYRESVNNWMYVAAAVGAVQVGQRLRPLFGIGFLVVCVGAIRIFCSSSPAHPEMGQIAGLALDQVSGASLAFFLAMTLPAIAVGPVQAGRWLDVISMVAVGDALWIFVNWAFHLPAAAMIGTVGVDTYFVALCMPIFIWRRQWALCFILTLCCLGPSKRVGLMCMAIGWCAWLVTQGTRRQKILGYVLPVAAFFGLWAYQRGEFLMFEDRKAIWALALTTDPGWFGEGLGAWTYLGPELQKASGPLIEGRHQAMSWIHNEWMQVWFDLGWIGLATAVCVFGYALVLLRKSGPYPVMLAIFGLGALAEPILRFPLTALVGAILLRLAGDRSLSVGFR